MSIIACKILPNGYEMASDSITVRGYTQTKGQTSNFSKLFEINQLVIGGAGYSQENSLMRLFAETRSIASPNEYSILEYMSEFSDWKKKKTDDESVTNHFMIGCLGKVFLIEGWHIQEITSYMAIGAGMDFALAALYLGNSATKAVEVATQLSVYCEAPIVTITKTI